MGLGVRCEYYSLQLTTCIYVRTLGSWANHCEHEIMIHIFVVILQFFDLPGSGLELRIEIFVIILQFFELLGTGAVMIFQQP